MSDYRELKREEHRHDAWAEADRLYRDEMNADGESLAVQIDLKAQELANRTAPAWTYPDQMNLGYLIHEHGDISEIFAHLIGNDSTPADPLRAADMVMAALRVAAEEELE